MGVSVWIANKTLHVSPWIMGFVCGIGSTLAGGILVLFFSWVFRNSLATRPTVSGALYGAGAGLAINAGWRIACPISTPWHALGAHGAAIIATVILGSIIGRSLGNRRLNVRYQKDPETPPEPGNDWLAALLPVQEMFRRVDFLGNKTESECGSGARPKADHLRAQNDRSIIAVLCSMIQRDLNRHSLRERSENTVARH